MTSCAIRGTEESGLPKIHYFGTVTSTFDVAFELAEQGRLAEWDSVVAVSQTEGRGQMRRHWDSPPGNLYASLRLPVVEPFQGNSASVAIGALCANALRSFGCPIRIKWPNDLIVIKDGNPAKMCGILLEQRADCLLAGIGINVHIAPDITGADGEPFMPSAALAAHGQALPSPPMLWQALVRHFYTTYKYGPSSLIWKDIATELLLWRGEQVTMRDRDGTVNGILLGIGEKGGALLEIDGRPREIASGSMTLSGREPTAAATKKNSGDWDVFGQKFGRRDD